MSLVSVNACSIRSGLAFARRLLEVPLKGHEAAIISGGEDSLYRVTLISGHEIELSVEQHARATGEILC